MGKWVRLPKPVYDLKPYVYMIAGFGVAMYPAPVEVRAIGLFFGCFGVGYLLNRMGTKHDNLPDRR